MTSYFCVVFQLHDCKQDNSKKCFFLGTFMYPPVACFLLYKRVILAVLSSLLTVLFEQKEKQQGK